MVVVRDKSPVINDIRPKTRPENQQKLVWLEGEGFTATSTVTIGGVAPASVLLLADGRLQCLIAASQPANENADIVVTQGVYDSLPFPFELTPGTPQLGDYIEPVLDQQVVVLPASFKGRNDQQRIAAGSQFIGTPPNTVQGIIGTGGPTSGGLWQYNQKVQIEEIEWYSRDASGVKEEALARSALSGIYIGRASGSETLIIDLENTRFSAEISTPYTLGKGDYIKIITIGATLEMVANVRHIAENNRPTR